MYCIAVRLKEIHQIVNVSIIGLSYILDMYLIVLKVMPDQIRHSLATNIAKQCKRGGQNVIL